MLRLILFLAATGIGTGCSSASAPSGDAATFSDAPFATITSDNGQLVFDMRAAPDPTPARGVDSIELTVRRAAGASADGLVIDAVPWMPAMGHGASVRPTVEAKGDGKYVLTNVNFFMPGQWQLRLTFSGPVEDHATPVLQIP